MFFSTISKFLTVSLRDQLISLKNKLIYCHNLSFAQVKDECKFLELCLIQHSAKVRYSALLAISSFLSPSHNVKNICRFFFLK